MVYFNQMVGGMEGGTSFGKWAPDAPVPGGTEGGPTVLFTADQARALVLSPWTNPLAGSSVRTAAAGKDDAAPAPAALEFGLLGSIASVPAGFEFGTAAWAGAGVNDAVRGFGGALLRLRGKLVAAAPALDPPASDPNSSDSSAGSKRSKALLKPPPVAWPWLDFSEDGDLSISHLGVYTDNGAYYYYNGGEAELMAVHDAAVEQRIPFRSVLLDSWWYYKGHGGGVKNWTATAAAFPRGLAAFHGYTGWPIVGHNRYWSDDTDYAAQNGGAYAFVVEPHNQKALPTTEVFWEDLLTNASRGWGLSVYEQDWLHNEWEGLDATLQSATLGRRWLLQMGAGADKAGVRIQYCMAYPRFALASAEVPAVNQIRVTDDYAVGTSLLLLLLLLLLLCCCCCCCCCCC